MLEIPPDEILLVDILPESDLALDHRAAAPRDGARGSLCSGEDSIPSTKANPG
jgi:hypothetical protein